MYWTVCIADSMPNATAKPGRRSLLRKDEPALWYAAAAAFPDLEAPTGSNQPQPDDVLVEAKRAEAEIALERETELFEADMGRKGGQDARWLQQVRRSGTTADKVAANSLVIQASVCDTHIKHSSITSSSLVEKNTGWLSVTLSVCMDESTYQESGDMQCKPSDISPACESISNSPKGVELIECYTFLLVPVEVQKCEPGLWVSIRSQR